MATAARQKKGRPTPAKGKAGQPVIQRPKPDAAPAAATARSSASAASEPAEIAARGWVNPVRGVRVATLLLALFGLGVSIYLTIQHFDSSIVLSCPANSTINCEKVTTSSYSKLFGIPVALLGLLFFTGLVTTFIPWLTRLPRIDEARIDQIRLGMCAVGILMVLYLVWAELFQIDAICLWCTSVHVLTLILLGTTAWAVNERR
jgi:uncharacterized membrane protein